MKTNGQKNYQKDNKNPINQNTDSKNEREKKFNQISGSA